MKILTMTDDTYRQLMARLNDEQDTLAAAATGSDGGDPTKEDVDDLLAYSQFMVDITHGITEGEDDHHEERVAAELKELNDSGYFG